MLKRLKVGTGAVLGLGALALGGSAIATANSTTPSHPATHVSKAAEPVAGPDTDTVQSGDQSTPDTAGSAQKSEPTGGPDGDNVQSGDQTTPDSSKASKAHKAHKAGKAGRTSEPSGENVPESSTSESSTSETAAPSDGPGGFADPAGNADTQQQGQN